MGIGTCGLGYNFKGRHNPWIQKVLSLPSLENADGSEAHSSGKLSEDSESCSRDKKIHWEQNTLWS